MNVQLTRLQNGVRVITAAMPQVESVALGIWVGVGVRHEPIALPGVSHFVEHMLFKGTRRRSALDISRDIEGQGGYLNAFTQEESTCYYARVAFDQLPLALDVLGDMYLNSTFDRQEIERERDVIVDEILMYRDEPQHCVEEMLGQALWKGHPLGRSLSGEPEAVEQMSREAILDYRHKRYVPRATVFAFAGQVDHAACLDAVGALVGRVAGGPRVAGRSVTAAVGQERVILQQRPVEQVRLAMGVRVFGRRDPRRYALRVLNAVLGENMSSRLFQVLREKHGLVYSVSSHCHLFRETGAMVVSAGLERSTRDRALRMIVREMRKLRLRRVGARELKHAQDFIIGQLRLGLESTTNQMSWIGENVVCHGRFIPPEDTVDRIRSVTPEDVRQVAEDVFVPESISTAMVCPTVDARDEGRVGELVGGIVE